MDPVKFTLPTETPWMVEQMQHEPSRAYAQEIFEVVSAHPYKQALEIGNDWGISTLAILLAGTGHLTSVDVQTMTYANEELEVNALQERCSLVYSTPSSEWWARDERTYDLIYIDGSHLYAQVKEDLYAAWDRLRENGLLFLDDFTHTANQSGEYGVAVAAWELVKEQQITRIATTTRLLCLTK